ncbi:vacuolar atp synthase subunit [Cyclospora cayetanensis]|uniref:V-type proton ATPase subunit H n=1 Tax=Cyclospora cayetanensis TaxID=88456 RepID=A0A1D3CWA9_9EIME|nr:vacuolar atp synthase subunit [Cyclospora cayetanensis]
MATTNTPPMNVSHDQTEQVQLLGQLTPARRHRAECANCWGLDGLPVKQEAVMERMPEWTLLEGAGLIGKGMAAALSTLHGMTPEERSNAFEEEPLMVSALVSVLRLEADLHPAQYALTVLYEAVRENCSRYEAMCGVLAGSNVYGDFMQLLERQGVDTYTGDRAAFMLSGFMCRARTHAFPDDQVQYFVQGLIQQKFPVSESGRLDALVNILKIDRWRPLVWETRGLPDVLQNDLSLMQPAGVIYKAVFCVWLLSFHEGFPLAITEAGILRPTCEVLKECRVEKVVRVGLHVVENLLSCEEAVEIIVEENVAQILTLLEFEKWRDPDMYDEIRACIFALDLKIRQFNNFERYLMELDKGKFKWSVLHSEKFWRENVMVFEKDEFATIQKIEKLLDSDDPTTQAVACYDLGEFARLHPAGKKVCQKFKVKDKVMLLISSKHREVAAEALLCVQKLMLNNWQDVAKPPN